MLLIIFIVFLSTLILTRVLSEVLILIGLKYDFMDTEGHIGHLKKIRPVPNIGGISIFISIFLVLYLYKIITTARAGLFSDTFNDYCFLIIFISALLLHLIGFLDDRKGLSPWLKLVFQLLSSVFVAIYLDLDLLNILDSKVGLNGLLSKTLAVLWIVIVTNGINYFDNIDGLVSGLVFVLSIALSFFAILSNEYFFLLVLVAISGSSCSFFLVNRPPARLFLGDSGSLVFGFLLGVLSLGVTYWDFDGGQSHSDWALLFCPICIFFIVIYDICTVSWIRWKQGKNLFVGDQQHLTHRLLIKGFTNWQVLLIIWILGVVTSFLGLIIFLTQTYMYIIILMCILLILLLLFDRKVITGLINESDIN